ncbi:MAG: hypothetical protein NZM31_00330 [Gemmatales bacterium]|nr:hypothetical protein [Gemmatales bacterium]MDW8385439.1 hypothetical protein [Gemmatales bacterium]
MRILFAIPHYFDPSGDAKHGSVSPNRQPRIQALSACIASLHQTFGRGQWSIHIARRLAESVPRSATNDIEIVICTTGDRHLLSELPIPGHLYVHYPTRAEPTLLGFECHAVLRDRLGLFDYFCYLEDDLILRDPLFFVKLGWFLRQVGTQNVLQPNRCELSVPGPCHKLYVDGDLAAHVLRPYRNVQQGKEFTGRVMGLPIRFVPAGNPHAGCFFLNAEQMTHWVRQPHFLDRDTSFIGPLESAATLGLLKTFRVYKPAPENAGFLEVQHFGGRFMSLIGKSIAPPEDAMRIGGDPKLPGSS